jgi:nucleotide-binding universal stress UspA family protein
MKHILVLVDFTETAKIALDQSIAIAKDHKAKISIYYVSDSPNSKVVGVLKDALEPYGKRVEEKGLEHEIIIGYGDLFAEVNALVRKIRPNLVVVGTHGIQGLKQNLFGSAIHKLVKAIPAPTLVVNDKTKVVEGGFKKVMIPVSPHIDFIMKVKKTCKVLSKEGEVVLFALIKPGSILDKKILANIEEAKQYLDEKKIKWSYLESEAEMYSIGYSTESLAKVEESNMDLISIMANVAPSSQIYGKMDKEKVLLNDQGLPVLCVNH